MQDRRLFLELVILPLITFLDTLNSTALYQRLFLRYQYQPIIFIPIPLTNLYKKELSNHKSLNSFKKLLTNLIPTTLSIRIAHGLSISHLQQLKSQLHSNLLLYLLLNYLQLSLEIPKP